MQYLKYTVYVIYTDLQNVQQHFVCPGTDSKALISQ